MTTESTPPPSSGHSADRIPEVVRRVLGIVLGAGLGTVLFVVAASQGLQAPALPGAAVGLGCGWLGRSRSLAWALLCGAVALVLSVWLEWTKFPFVADGSLAFFVQNLHRLPPVHLGMLLLGVLLAILLGRGT